MNKKSFDKREFILIGFIVIFFIVAFSVYPGMPERVPIHWNEEGVADGYGSPFTAAFLFPLVMVGVYLLFFIIPKIAVFKKNIDNFKQYFFGFKLVFILFMLVIYVSSIVQIYRPFNMNLVIVPLLSFLFAFLAVFLKHTKRNFFIGIRTPWTLSSDFVWKKTHELGGYLFGAYALVILSLLILPGKFFIWVVLCPIFIILVIIIVYSYLLFQREQKHKKK